MTDSDLHGKVVVLTGANAGIGRETAVELARRGATLVAACRTPAKAEAAAREIAVRSENTAVTPMACDLSSFASIRSFAAELGRRFDRVDVLVNNAGVWLEERSVTVDGYETTFATNHLGTFLLTSLLLDSLKAAKAGRIVVVASAMEKQGDLDFSDLQNERAYNGVRAYSRSKRANLHFTYELARRLSGGRVTVNALHPGVVRTNLGGDNTGVKSFFFKLAKSFFMSAEDGARTSVYVASSPQLEGVSGRYFIKSRPAFSSRASQDEQTGRKLWDISEDLTHVSAQRAAS